MTQILQRYLLFIRKKYNKNKVLTIIINLFLIILLSIGMFYIDNNLSITNVINFLRTFLIAINALSIFTFFCIIIESIKDKKLKENENYISFKDSLSHNQRVNFTIITTVIIIFLHVLIFKPTSSIYSIISSSVLSIILLLINFTTMNRYERYLEVNDYMDMRDVEHAENLMDEQKREEED